MRLHELYQNNQNPIEEGPLSFIKGQMAKQAGKADTAKKAKTLWQGFQRALGAQGIKQIQLSHLQNFLKQYGVDPALVQKVAGVQDTSKSEPASPGPQASNVMNPDIDYDQPAVQRRQPKQQNLPLENVNESVALTGKQAQDIILKVVQADPNLQKSDDEKIPGALIDQIKKLSDVQRKALIKAIS